MNLEALHHRLAMGMAVAGVAAAWGGGVFSGPVGAAATAALLGTLVRRPQGRNVWLERGFAVAAAFLAVRAGYMVLVMPDQRLVGMVELLLLLLVAEAWKPVGEGDDVRLYVLSFGVLVAATVFRPGLIFGLAFVAFVAFSTVTIMVGHLRRKAQRYDARDVRVGKRFLLGTGALSMVTLFISVAVFLAFPRVSRGWAPGGSAFATRIAGFADQVSLDAHGATIATNPEVVLRVEFPDGRPENTADLHWRGRSYDHFDGVRWSRTGNMPRSGPRPGAYRRLRDGSVIRQEIYSSLLTSRVLFALHPVLEVEARSRIRPFLDQAGDIRFAGAVPPRYVARSIRERPDPATLRAAPGGRAPAEPYYLQLPDLSPRVSALADSLTAGQGTRFDRARAIEGWLRSLEYTRELPATPAETGLEYFLFERQAGHCEYFSTAMVVLLRAVGIPARNVNGFLGGHWNDVGNHLAVTQNHAHSWVEVWHPGSGWVTYDPTPAGSAGEADAARAWFWPGRLLLDGLQHRWAKWVLDYSLDHQAGMFRRAADLLEGDGRRRGEAGDRELFGGWLWVLAGLGVAVLLWLGWRARPSRPPVTRLYLRLRRAYEDHGFDGIPLAAPLDFAAAVTREEAPGARPAASAARRYVRVRFGGMSAEDELAAMREELAAALRLLRG